MTRVITFGTFDVFHVGHVNILQRAQELGDTLIVGISSDALNMSKKGRNPIFSEDDRMRIVSSVYGVDEVFLEESLELKRDYLIEHKADLLVMGDDWEGRFDHFSDICAVKYFPRTDGISTSYIIEKINSI